MLAIILIRLLMNIIVLSEKHYTLQIHFFYRRQILKNISVSGIGTNEGETSYCLKTYLHILKRHLQFLMFHVSLCNLTLRCVDNQANKAKNVRRIIQFEVFHYTQLHVQHSVSRVSHCELIHNDTLSQYS